MNQLKQLKPILGNLAVLAGAGYGNLHLNFNLNAERQGYKMTLHVSIMTSEEIGHLTQTAHKFVLKRARKQLAKSGINPNDFWSEYTDLITGKAKKRLHLPKRECLLAINDDWYSDKAIAQVMAVWNVWDLEEEIK